MDKSKQMLTIKLKLHNPSQRKKQIIDEALINYSKACQFLLDIAQKNIEKIIQNSLQHNSNESAKYRAVSLGGWMDKEICRQLNEFNIEPFKDSIKLDIATMLATYLTAKKKNIDAGFPEINLNSDKKRPIFFCRYAINRNYSILFNRNTEKYYAKIYLMNVRNEKRTESLPTKDKSLVYIDKDKTAFKDKGGKKTYLIFPLSFGAWQEKYLKQAIVNPKMLKTARLVKEKNDYFLSINLAMDKPEAIETSNYMGISRGIANLINYAIVDSSGQQLAKGKIAAFNGEKVQNKIDIATLHKIANRMINTAAENKCSVILEKLVERNDGLEFVDKDGRVNSPAMDVKAYNKLCDLLDYKMSGRGLPVPVKASAVNLFCTCTTCGNIAKANRFSSRMLICTRCGMSMDVESVGSENLSKRLLKYKGDKIKIAVEKQDGRIRFLNNDLDLDFIPVNPYDCMEEFKNEIDRLMQNFSINIPRERLNSNFKKKYSLMKKLESTQDVLSVLHLE